MRGTLFRMDPTLAALLGAGVGALVTAMSPWLNGRIQHRSRRREIMREAYLQGMQAIAAVGNIQSVDDCTQAKRELWEARLAIRLAGSRRTSGLYNDVADAANQYVQAALDQFHERRSVPDTSGLPDVGVLNETFVSSARRDMGMEDQRHRQIRRWARRIARRTEPAKTSEEIENDRSA